MKFQSRTSFQHGLSLVELMVALAVGMLLIVGFLQIFLSVRSTYATNEASSRVQENGRFALDFLSQHARMAGYRDPKHIDRPLPIMPPSGNGCIFSSGSNSAFCTLNRGAIIDADENEETGDRIAFTYQPPLIDGKRWDCAGTEIEDDDNIIINVFTTRSTATSSGLVCRSIVSDGTEIPGSHAYVELVDGIDAVQFQYGLAQRTAANESRARLSVRQYVTANQITSERDWEDVVALRIAVLANSITPVSPAPAEKEYYLLDAGPYTFTDGKMRQVFTTTVYLRNSVQ